MSKSITFPPLKPIIHPIQTRIESHFKTVDINTLPVSFRTNSSEEENVLEYVDNFRRQFGLLYPQRGDLLLFPKNECGVQKFISTTIRPTKIPFKKINDFDGCARFISDFITYEPLLEPTRLVRKFLENSLPNKPEWVQSPSITLEWQAGNCFDLSILLVSLLIGAGYDAYCVSGYADQYVTMNDQSRVEYPGADDVPKNSPKIQPIVETVYDKLIITKPSLESKFLQLQAQKKLQNSSSIREKGNNSGEQSERDPLQGCRVHCWVLVMPPRRDVEEPIFIEPSTGRVFPVKSPDSSYIAIESIWNNTNYWVNMQDTRDSVHETSFLMNDLTKWEFVFLDRKEEVQTQKDYLEMSSQMLLEVPPSWVGHLEISKEKFESTYPNHYKTVVYKKCRVEYFTEYHRNDGLVRRVQFYSDSTLLDTTEIREYYTNRQDYLKLRIRYPHEEKVYEAFDKGKLFDLHYHTYKEGVSRELCFFPGSRVDGLVRREVIVSKKIEEIYEERDDRLIYRSGTFDLNSSDEVTRLFDGRVYLPLRKVTQKYSRDPSIPADKDINKITFFLDQRRIEIVYHKEDGKITASTRTYTKDGKARGFVANPTSTKQVNVSEVNEDYQKLLQIERDCVQKLRDTEREILDILEKREEEEKHIALRYSIYDVKKNKNPVHRQQVEDVSKSEMGDKQEWVSIFLNSFTENGKKPLTADLAKAVVDAAMKAYKERLKTKERLILTRLEKENKLVKKRQAILNKNPDMDRDEEEEHQKIMAEANFRKRILEQRHSRHKALYQDKCLDMEKRLHGDPRLVAFFK